MNAKQLIERNLPFSGKYYYVGLTRGSIESGMVTSCCNCAKIITNMVEVIDQSNGKRLQIGTDCAETLAKAGCIFNYKDTDFYQDIYEYNKAARFVREVNAGCEMKDNGFELSLTSRKGKQMSEFKSTVEKYFPEIL